MILGLYAQYEEFTWLEFDVPADLDRVLVAQSRQYPWARVWGFRGEGHTPEQVECKLLESHKGWVPS